MPTGIMYKEKNNGPRTVPCGTPDTTGAQSDITIYTINYYPNNVIWRVTSKLFSSDPFLPEAQKSIYPFQCLSTYTITKQFAFKKFVWRDVHLSIYLFILQHPMSIHVNVLGIYVLLFFFTSITFLRFGGDPI